MHAADLVVSQKYVSLRNPWDQTKPTFTLNYHNYRLLSRCTYSKTEKERIQEEVRDEVISSNGFNYI